MVDEESLYAGGWRQGSIVRARLAVTTHVVKEGEVVSRTTEAEEWVVATQDCDLARAKRASNESIVDLLPVQREFAAQDWGIRSRKLRLHEDGQFVDSDAGRCQVSPAVLSSDAVTREDRLTDSRKVALKTWLGLRYDRPAVPDELVPLARRIAKEIRDARPVEMRDRIRDVLIEFDDSADPPHFSLYAVLEDATDEDEARLWLLAAGRALPAELGVLDDVEARDGSQISLQVIENTYSADTSQITWGGGPEPTGAN
jgi:hypothetical protein